MAEVLIFICSLQRALSGAIVATANQRRAWRT